MGQAGKFDKTVSLQSPVMASNADPLGHWDKSYALFQKCAARIWTSTAAEQSSNPAEFPASTLRLLLRQPPKVVMVGWGIVYSAVDYEIAATEERGDDLLVTLQPR